MKLNSDQLYTIGKVAEHRRVAMTIYSLDPDTQRDAWESEIRSARESGDYVFAEQDEWLVDIATQIDAVQPSAQIYLIDEATNVDDIPWQDANIEDNDARIVVWGKIIAFFGGNGACLVYAAGTTKYVRFGSDLMTNWWPTVALSMLAASQRPAKARPIGTNERYTLARAKYKPRRDFYYVPHVRYDVGLVKPSKGGKHASPVAHVRSAHKALLTRVSVEAVEAEDLKARGYTLVWTEELPAEVLDGMTRRGKAPTPGTLNAYQWIDKRASRVNPDGEQAQRVTLIRDR